MLQAVPAHAAAGGSGAMRAAIASANARLSARAAYVSMSMKTDGKLAKYASGPNELM